MKKIAGTEVTIFVYDADGKLVAEYANQIAQPSDAKVSYLTSDHLGSPRINTDQNGLVTARHDYQPFGEEIARASYGADTNRKQFATYESDKLQPVIRRMTLSCNTARQQNLPLRSRM